MLRRIILRQNFFSVALAGSRYVSKYDVVNAMYCAGEGASSQREGKCARPIEGARTDLEPHVHERQSEVGLELGQAVALRRRRLLRAERSVVNLQVGVEPFGDPRLGGEGIEEDLRKVAEMVLCLLARRQAWSNRENGASVLLRARALVRRHERLHRRAPRPVGRVGLL